MTPEQFGQILTLEPKAVRRFVQDYGPVMRGAVRKRLKGPMQEHVDEVLNEILARLFEPCPETRQPARDLRKYDLGGRPLRSFLYYYAEKRTQDWMRRWHRQHQNEVQIGDEEMLDSIGTAAAEDELPEWVALVFGRFHAEGSEQDLGLYQLYFVEERSGREVAEALGLEANTVYQRAKRLKARLNEIREEVLAALRRRDEP